jgi:hypothetical protein
LEAAIVKTQLKNLYIVEVFEHGEQRRQAGL